MYPVPTRDVWEFHFTTIIKEGSAVKFISDSKPFVEFVQATEKNEIYVSGFVIWDLDEWKRETICYGYTSILLFLLGDKRIMRYYLQTQCTIYNQDKK